MLIDHRDSCAEKRKREAPVGGMPLFRRMTGDRSLSHFGCFSTYVTFT